MHIKTQKTVEHVLRALHIVVGVGALAGGFATIMSPKAPMGMSPEEVVTALQNTPFNDFLIPGIILFTVIGIGHLLSAIVLGLKVKFKAYISGTFACALIIWIVVQCSMLRSIVFLHILFFTIGAVQGILASILLFQAKLFPADRILKIWTKYSHKDNA